MAKNTDHDCEGMMCFHPSHFEDGGEVHKVKGNPIQDPDPEKAKNAVISSQSGGPSMGQAWENVKNELGFGKSAAPKAGYAKGGRVEYVPGEPEYGYRDKYEEGGKVTKKEQNLRDKERSMKFEKQHGSVGVHHGGDGEGSLKGRSAAGINAEWAGKHKNPNHAEYARQKAKYLHSAKLEESRAMPAPNLKGLAEGGEVEMDMDGDMDNVDHELMEMCAHECMEALKSGDKKGFLDAIKAIVMSCKE